MKKLLSLILSMTLVFSLAACSEKTTSSEGGNSEQSYEVSIQSEGASSSRFQPAGR